MLSELKRRDLRLERILNLHRISWWRPTDLEPFGFDGKG